MDVHELISVVGKNHSLVLDDLPFLEGQTVKVTVVREVTRPELGSKYPLRGKVIQYDSLTEPVDDEVSEALE